MTKRTKASSNESIKIEINGWDEMMDNAPGPDVDDDDNQSMTTMSSAFLYNASLVWHGDVAGEEYVSYPFETFAKQYLDDKTPIKSSLLAYNGIVTTWGMTWQARGMRRGLHAKSLEGSLARFAPVAFDESGFDTTGLDVDIHLLPKIGHTNYLAHAPFYHVLPRALRKQVGLPSLGAGMWPPPGMGPMPDRNGAEISLEGLPRDFDARLARAFARLVWPFLRYDRRGSRIDFFDDSEPLVVLAHNLDFWLPHIDRVLRRRMSEFPVVTEPGKGDPKTLAKLNAGIEDTVPARFEAPLKGGHIFHGEEDALEVVRETVEEADRNGALRALVDAIRSHRVEDDFSSRWSYEKEDFERKLYGKRRKVPVHFVELPENIPIVGGGEYTDGLVYSDMMAILDRKEKEVVVCLSKGATTLVETAKELGYANHSAVSKKLAKIREKVERELLN